MRDYLLYLIISVVLSVLFMGNLQAQGNTCDNAIRISDPSDYCSREGQYDTRSLTPSTYDAAHCFQGKNKDIWFEFTAVATDLTLIVRGDAQYSSAGTMQQPEVSLNSGNCGGTLSSLRCESDQSGENVVELRRGGLVPGMTYLIRVQSARSEGGSFQFCLTNNNPPVNPGSDCDVASILCDKSTFTVEHVTGAGNDPTEMNDAECFYSAGIGQNYESSSTWFKFTCKTSGTLEFTLTPLNITDDIDFVLYALPNGLNDCSDKEVIRCMAAGEFPELYPSPCLGPTGLRAGSNDISEPAGCPPGNDNFLAPADLVEGRSYVLAVNNYSDTGHGFKVEWGGSAEFMGPEPEIEIQAFDENQCYSDPLTILDASSTATGEIISWNWFFGPDATPSSADGKGPHEIQYDKAGVKIIHLLVESDRGCVSTITDTIELHCCGVEEFVDIGGDVSLELGERHTFNPAVQLKGSEISYSWSPDSTLSCYKCESPTATPTESEVKYTLRVEDEFGCSASDEATIFVDIVYPVYAPNAFTPNGDGVNDMFTLFAGMAVKEIKVLEVYNRWGDKVFTQMNFPAGDIQYGWDGKFKGHYVEQGIYMYRAVVLFIDGKKRIFTGDLTILY